MVDYELNKGNQVTMQHCIESVARDELFEICRLAYARGYLCGTEGNLSIRIDNNVLISTPSNSCKGLIEKKELILTDLDGNLLPDQNGRPSTELKMHLLAYKTRPDVNAIVHAHPTVTVAFTVAGKPLSTPILPEVVCVLGSVPVAEYATPSTDEVPESLRPFITDYDAIVLDHHGALTLGTNIRDAFYKMEMLEHHAQTLMMAHVLGGAVPISEEQINKLLAVRSVYGLTRPVRVSTK